MICELEDKIFNISDNDFDALSLEIFRYQFANNKLYKAFTEALNIDPSGVRSVASIPFLPVSFFKSHEIVAGEFEPEAVFESSGTTSTGNSRHLVKSLDIYRQSFFNGFESFYGPVSEWCIIALLPSYLERSNSSLVLMVDELMKKSNHALSGFYLYEHDKLFEVLMECERKKQKTLLIGVTFALLDFAAKFSFPMKHIVVMETGGMKGRRKEITREEVHWMLRQAWQLESIHSEYGMTELLSQAYSIGDGKFYCPAWMKILLREEDDPLSVITTSDSRLHQGFGVQSQTSDSPLSRGLVNIIDLANLYSCSFIAVDDIGTLYADGSFEILGRLDSSDLRGCSLMVSEK